VISNENVNSDHFVQIKITMKKDLEGERQKKIKLMKIENKSFVL